MNLCILCHRIAESIREHGIMCPNCKVNILCDSCYNNYDTDGDGRFKGSGFAQTLINKHCNEYHHSVDLV